MWEHSKLKEAGVNIHVVATGAGAGFQQELWETPGSSAYLSGASFPYAPEEQEELLGFMPEHFCSMENAVDLASAAYMKAYKFGGKKPVGVGIAASVASEKAHRGPHHAFVAAISDEKIYVYEQVFDKGVGFDKRKADGILCDELGLCITNDILGAAVYPGDQRVGRNWKDGTELARQRFFNRSFFTAEGKRYNISVVDMLNPKRFALMPGAFNPPHEGHYGASDTLSAEYGLKTVFEITSDPPHKDALSVQDMLKRAKLLQGHDRIITQGIPFYLQKARAYPGMPIVMGADAFVRLLDPKWAVNMKEFLSDLSEMNTTLYISGRDIDGKFTTHQDISGMMYTQGLRGLFLNVSKAISGEWHISSTQIRNRLL
jgi:nicotinamide mononucleotide (NMN) deamidase PncC